MKQLEEIFRSMILTMLKRKGKIDDDLIQKLMNWDQGGDTKVLPCGYLQSQRKIAGNGAGRHLLHFLGTCL